MPIVQMRKLRLREKRHYLQGHAAARGKAGTQLWAGGSCPQGRWEVPKGGKGRRPRGGATNKSPGGGPSALMTARQKPHSMSGILSPVGVLLCCCHLLVPPHTPGRPPSLAARGGCWQAAGLGPQPTDQWPRLRQVSPTHTKSPCPSPGGLE